MRIFAASLATETNTFSPIPTSRRSFEASFYAGPGKHPDEPKLCTAPLFVARRRAREEGFTLIEGSCFWAEPSGHGGAQGLRVHARRDPGPAAAGDAGRCGAAGVARGLRRGGLRRRRGRPPGARTCHRRRGVRGRLRVRPALPYDGEAHPPRHRVDRVQGVPPRRLPGARRGAGRAGAQDAARPDPAGGLALRRAHVGLLSHHGRADALLRRPDQGAGRQGRDTPHLHRARLPACRRAGHGHARARLHRRPQGRRRSAGHAAWRRDLRQPRQVVPADPRHGGGLHGSAFPQRPARHHRRALRQRRRRCGVGLYAGDPRADCGARSTGRRWRRCGIRWRWSSA